MNHTPETFHTNPDSIAQIVNPCEIRLGDFVDQIEAIIPAAWAESWDRVGLQLGDPDTLVRGVVLSLDVTASTVALAESNNANLIITHHPLIFSPLNSLREDCAEEALIRLLIHQDLAVLAMHTNLDAAPGGTADSLADSLELQETDRTLFLPLEATEGEAGHGRVIQLATPIHLKDLHAIVTRQLGSLGVRANTDCDRLVSRLAVFPGSFDEAWVNRLVEQGIDAIITGELKHHVGLMLNKRTIAALDTGHDVSERIVLPRLQQQLSKLHPELTFAVDYGFDYNKMTF